MPENEKVYDLYKKRLCLAVFLTKDIFYFFLNMVFREKVYDLS